MPIPACCIGRLRCSAPGKFPPDGPRLLRPTRRKRHHFYARNRPRRRCTWRHLRSRDEQVPANTVNYIERLHALDLATGQNFLAPVTIQASFPGNGAGTDGHGNVIFDAAKERGRAGLLLTNGSIYTEWASFCDFAPFTGWIIAYNERTFAQTAVFNANPNGAPTSSDLPDGSGSGIWQAGSPAGVDAAGNLYVSTGNGPFDTNLNSNGFPVNRDFGDTFLKLTPSLTVTDYFTPSNQLTLTLNDGDFNSGGHLIVDIADSSKAVHHLAITAGKDNNLYLLNRDNLREI